MVGDLGGREAGVNSVNPRLLDAGGFSDSQAYLNPTGAVF